MHSDNYSQSHLSEFLCRAAAVVFFACAGSLGAQAQQTATDRPLPVLTATVDNPVTLPSFRTSDLGYSSSAGAAETEAAENFIASATSELQPPPRRRYGRPRYNDSSHNADGSNKWTGEGAVGLTLPIGDTLRYNTDSYAYSAGFGRQWSKKFALMLQFDWDNFGLQGATISNQSNLYFGATGQGLDGNTHVWSFSLDPSYQFLDTESFGAYVVGGVGFFHKVTTFTIPEQGVVCYYYCEEVVENAALDHYTSNAPGFDAGFGLTYKFSRFASEKFFLEARYVVMLNSQRYGLTVANENTTYGTNYTGSDFYPANSNRTAYIPVKVGIRF